MRLGLLLLLAASPSVALGAETASAPAATTAAAAAPATLAAVPVETDIAAQQQAVRSLYKTDYANKDPAKRTELAQKLIQLSATGTSAERIALLREAIFLAGSVGDLDVAHSAYDTIVQNWAVDADGERLAMYKNVVVSTPDQAESAINDLLAASGAAINADNYTMAQKQAEAAGGFARKAGDEVMAKRAKTAADLARDLGSEYYRITDNADMLGNLSPAQTAALGRFYALSKCDWTRALPMLAHGDDATLKGLATDDLAAATGPDHEAIGERWIDYARKVPAKQRPGLIRHGLDHLIKAADVSTGLAKARLDKRIADLQGQAGIEHGGPALPPGVVLWLGGDAGPDGHDPVDGGPAQLPVQVEGKLQLLREGHGGFMRFSGTESISVTLKTPLAENAPLTFTCWLRYAGKSTRGCLLNLYADGFIDAQDFPTSLLIAAEPKPANEQLFFPQVTVTSVKAWHHLAFVFDPLASASWYVDGALALDDALKHGPLVAPIDHIQIGDGLFGKLVGDLDSVGLWKRALSADEIKALFAAESSGRSNP